MPSLRSGAPKLTPWSTSASTTNAEIPRDLAPGVVTAKTV